MSKLETPLTRAYWEKVGGTLVEEFYAVQSSSTCGKRVIDGVIIRGGKKYIARSGEVNLAGKDIIIVQTKAGRLGMYLMGQAFFSAELMKRFKPASILSVALCLKDDSVLRPIFESYPNMKVEVISCP
jgi:hypothetical protein